MVSFKYFLLMGSVSFELRKIQKNTAFSLDVRIMNRKQKTDNIGKCTKRCKLERKNLKAFEYLLVNTPTDAEEYLQGNHYYSNNERKASLEVVSKTFHGTFLITFNNIFKKFLTGALTLLKISLYTMSR